VLTSTEVEMPSVRAIAAGLRAVFGVVPQAHPPVVPPFQTGDMIIWVGQGGATSARANLERAVRAGALAIHFNTGRLYGDCFALHAVVHEYWGLNQHSINNCRPATRRQPSTLLSARLISFRDVGKPQRGFARSSNLTREALWAAIQASWRGRSESELHRQRHGT
jgi:hypothetical protein